MTDVARSRAGYVCEGLGGEVTAREGARRRREAGAGSNASDPDVAVLDVTDSDVTDSDVTDSDVTDSDVTGSDVTRTSLLVARATLSPSLSP